MCFIVKKKYYRLYHYTIFCYYNAGSQRIKYIRFKTTFYIQILINNLLSFSSFDTSTFFQLCKFQRLALISTHTVTLVLTDSEFTEVRF